jgi:Arc/MetJ-type ribon-helix-helix transcriptional regulator
MPPISEVTIRLDEATSTALNLAMADGRFSSAADVVGAALQDWLARSRVGPFAELALDEIEAGFDDEAGTDAAVVLGQLETHYMVMADRAAAP